jgi:hypothetical protein
MKTGSKKKSLRPGKFITRASDGYFSREHGRYGTDADHVPVIPGNDFAPTDGHGEESSLPEPAFGDADSSTGLS